MAYICEMLSLVNQYFEKQPEMVKQTLLAMRYFVLQPQFELTEHFKYHTAFYYFKGKPFCYFHKDAKTLQPYIGIARGHLLDHPMLFQGHRKKMKIVRISNTEDLPIEELSVIFHRLKALY